MGKLMWMAAPLMVEWAVARPAASFAGKRSRGRHRHFHRK
jgi:hypothetical protein